MPGSLIEAGPTHTSTPHPVSSILGSSLSLLIQQQGPSESDIRKRLAAEEEKEQFASAAVEPQTESKDDFTETKYLLYGLDLEEQQYMFDS